MSPAADAILAIEASQRRGGVAVRGPDGRDHVEEISAGGAHDDDLLAAIDRLYARLGLAPGRTAAVGVSVGPGGFTGLRVSVSTAKMLAESLGCAAVAVPTALVVAESCESPGPIVVALASKDDRAWVVRLDRAGGAWTMAGGGGLAAAGELDLGGVEALAGDRYLPPAFADACRRAGVRIVEPIFDPRACLAVTVRLYEKEETVSPLLLAPMYARAPAARVHRPRRVSSR